MTAVETELVELKQEAIELRNSISSLWDEKEDLTAFLEVRQDELRGLQQDLRSAHQVINNQAAVLAKIIQMLPTSF